MGSGSSASANTMNKGEHEIVKLMFPIYYSKLNVTSEEHQLASDNWNSILNDKSPEFLDRKQNDPKFEYSSNVTFFYDTFYTRLFNVHPMSKNLFKSGMRAQGKFLVKMITLALSEINDSVKFDKTLIKLAEVHNERGVKAIEYGVVGEVLFWVLKKVTGTNYYDSKLHAAWVKVYSRMLRIIVPTAVSLELQTGSSHQIKRLTMSDSVMFEMEKVEISKSTEISANKNDDDDLVSENLRLAANVSNKETK